MIPQWTIEKKRDGMALSTDEIRAFIEGYTAGTIPDYQMAAMAMAIYLRGMQHEEIAALTDAMMRSGALISFEGWERPTADKHSTGGIGDNLSLIIAPLAASAGMAVPMIAGRGLGITGGTVDKLEAIPGFRTDLDIAAFKRVIAAVGCSIIGQTSDLAPADRKLYALRDVTATVSSIPLITASIMAKKLAEGCETLVLDVKCGEAAFMRELPAARELAQSMLSVGQALGRKMAVIISEMHQPLGSAAGNAVEVASAIEVLKGGGRADTRQLALELVARMGLHAGIFQQRAEALASLTRLLDGGDALEVFGRMIAAQGGQTSVLERPQLLPQPLHISVVEAAEDGYVSQISGAAIGRIALQLGAGRTTLDSAIDLAAGVDQLVEHGSRVARGTPLMRLVASTPLRSAQLLEEARKAVTITPDPPPLRQLILEELQ